MVHLRNYRVILQKLHDKHQFQIVTGVMTTFPTLRIGVLQSMTELQAQFHHDPHLFEAKDCPYDSETISALKQIFKVREVEKVVEKEVIRTVEPVKDENLTKEQQETVETTAFGLLDQLKELGEGEKGLDTSTKIQIIKAKTTLIDQLVKIRERVMNVKRVSVFQTVVISILDDLMEEDRRQEFLKRIEPYRD